MHATLTPTRAPPAQTSGSSGPPSTRSPSCAPAAPQRPPPPPSVQQLRVLRVPHNPRHAPAAEHTQRHNVVPPLLHNHERNAQRVLAHVLHALQPHAGQVSVMQCILLSSLCLWQHHNLVWPAASQCWKKYGAATVRVYVWPYSRLIASS
ncbi:hypothetical protein TcCL_ESM06745, partial [Trypanosoma cruzi]